MTAGNVTGGEPWFVVPARAGSKGIPRKNLRVLDERPLIQHVLETLVEGFGRDRVVVSTEDPEIARVADPFARIHQRSADLATDGATLDQVACEVAQWLIEAGAAETDYLLTVQPTSPFLSVATIEAAIEALEEGAGSVLTVKDDRHLRWRKSNPDGTGEPLYESRVNRQDLPPTFVETGGVIGTVIRTILETGTRIRQPVRLLEVGDREGLDVDTFGDWAEAEHHVERRRILIRADASPEIGMGHVYRALALSHELSKHDLTLVTRSDGEHRLGREFLSRSPYGVTAVASEEEFFELLESEDPDIAVLDVLDTSEEYTRELKERTRFLVYFENLGPGTRLADVVVNDLYTDLYPKDNHWYGLEHAILAPTFEGIPPRQPVDGPVSHILVTFGGTDPNDLTRKCLEALGQLHFEEEVTVVLGRGYTHEEPRLSDFDLDGSVKRDVENMAMLMRDCDLAVTSGGRTVTELMSVGVPTLVCCQNLRELRHTHASSPFGVINVGLGKSLTNESLAEHLKLLLNNHDLRRDMQRRAREAVRTRSNRRIVNRILEAADESSAARRSEG